MEAELRLVEVRDQDAAERLSFLGSPSVRIDGADIDAGADAGAGYALSCRMYGDAGVPPEELLVNALKSSA